MEETIRAEISAIKRFAKEAYPKCFREAQGKKFPFPFIVPGASYAYQLWDWDSWATAVALEQIAEEDISAYQEGCVLNFLHAQDGQGRIPINIVEGGIHEWLFAMNERVTNIHKPCLAQHAAFILSSYEDRSWLKEGDLEKLERFIAYYDQNQKSDCGLYFLIDDWAMGADNDPSAFYRPDRSTGSLMLNCFMFKELLAMAEIERIYGRGEKANAYQQEAEALQKVIDEECYDPRDEFFYSVDLNLKPVDPNAWIHQGGPRTYCSLPIRITYWTTYLPLWAKIATKEQAEALVKRHFHDENGLWGKYGLRSLGIKEKMYNLRKQGNPSNWQGPVWGIANYFAWKGLLNYGFQSEAKELAERLIHLFGQDVLKNGLMHEYYSPETGEGINNAGFQSWNLLMYEIAVWYENL